jgi:hypothetical protein
MSLAVIHYPRAASILPSYDLRNFTPTGIFAIFYCRPKEKKSLYMEKKPRIRNKLLKNEKKRAIMACNNQFKYK